VLECSTEAACRLTSRLSRRGPTVSIRVQQNPHAGGGHVPGRAGGYPTGPPTVPDVSNSLIRFVSIRAVLAVQITSRLTKPPGAELGCPSPVAENPLRRLVGSKSFPSVLPATRSPRPRLPSGGSFGPPFPTFCGTMLSYDCPVPLSGRFACRSLPHTLAASSVCVPLRARWPPEALCHRQGSWSTGTPALPAVLTRRHVALPSSRVPPVTPCPALRPRWSPWPSPCRASDCCLPLVPPRRLWLPSLRCAVILLSTTILISGLNPTAWGLAPSGSVLPLRGLHVEVTAPLLARRWGDGT
jgi:hypothetical protein